MLGRRNPKLFSFSAEQNSDNAIWEVAFKDFRVSALDSTMSGLGSRPYRIPGTPIVLCSWARHLTVPLSTRRCINGFPANLMLEGNLAMD